MSPQAKLMKPFPRLLLTLALACGAASAWSQTMYRCGNAYQDHPCSGGQQGRVIGTAAGPEAARASASSPQGSAQCAQRGIAAQKIKWMREAGRTQQEQSAAGGADANLIADVYNRQGSSTQVRAAVEADCNADQERAAQAAALVDAASKLKAGSASAAARPAASASQGGAAPQQPATDKTAANDAADRLRTCQQLINQRNDISNRQRAAGNSASSMASLQQQYLEAGERMRAAGC